MPGKKDPKKPKGRMSAYAFFVQERRADYKKKGEEVQFTAFSKECADLWKTDMSDDRKKKFHKKAEEDRHRYDAEMADYVPTEGYDAQGKLGGNVKKRRRKREKDPNQPKRAMSAFFWFAGDKRPKLKEQNPGATVGEIAKQLGAAWKIMTAEQKAPYEESAKKDRSRYEIEMAAYRKKPRDQVEPEEEEEEEEEECEDDED